MSFILTDFEDIYTAVCEELKVPLTDGSTLNRIKRDVNMIYINHVVPYKTRHWQWLEQKENIVTYEKIVTGTVSVIADSATITFSAAPSGSVVGYYFKLDGQPDIYKITAHTNASVTATIDKALVSVTIAGAGYTLWKDYASLSATMKSIVIVTHDRKTTPLEALTGSKLTEMRQRSPSYNGQPQYYSTGDFDAAGNLQIKWFPACSDQSVVLKVEGRQEAPALSADADEPLMPVEDRIVLFYGACSRAWSRERNDQEAGKNWTLFVAKLNEMAAKSGDAPQVVEIEVDRDYLRRKRYKRYGGGGRRFESE